MSVPAPQPSGHWGRAKRRAGRSAGSPPPRADAPKPELVEREEPPGADSPEPKLVEHEEPEPRLEASAIPDEFYAPEPEPPEPEPAPETVAAPPQRPRRLRAGFSVAGLAILAFATGLFVFNNLIMPRFIHRASDVRVPDLTNLTLEQAERALRPLGLTLSRTGERFDASVPRGFVISQDPPAETPVRGKKRVLVLVSLGEEFSSVPSLFGESLRGARYLLERAGLRVGGVSRAPSEEVGEGLVVASDPPAEAVLARETPISLLLSAGEGEESFVMPDLLGREIGGARRQLEALGFKVFTPPAAPTIGSVVFQDPPPGSRITRKSTILLQATGRIIR